MKEKDYIRDIAEIRSMMERSSKFLSLSGWSGILAGIYALSGAFIAHSFLKFNPSKAALNNMGETSDPSKVIFLAILILIVTLATAILLSSRKARKKNESTWNPTAKRLVINMAVPLITGGLLILILISQGQIGLIAPFSLIFYGLALYNASKYTYEEIRTLGLIEIVLGIIGTYNIEYNLIFWAIGFGIVHIIYGIFLHYKYER